MKFLIALSLCFGLIVDLKAQIVPKHTFNVELGMPVPMANEVFKGIMKSIVVFSPYYQYRLKNSLAFGAGLQYTYLQINKFKVPPAEPATGGVQSVGAFIKVSHEKFHNEQFATDFGVKVGYTQNYFVTDYNKELLGKASQVNSLTITPMLGLILSVDEVSSYRFTFGYTVQNYGFSPQRLGIQTNGDFDPASFSKSTGYLVVGFGYTHYF